MDSSIWLLVTTWFGSGRVDGPRPRPAGAAQLPPCEESTQHNILEATGSAINFIACVRAVLTKISRIDYVLLAPDADFLKKTFAVPCG
jgi:hypothetical protein